jgi:cytochrome c oxidase subunit 2
MSYEEKRDAIEEEVAPIVEHTGPIRKKSLGRILAIWVVMTAVGLFLALWAPQHLFPSSSSVEMHDVSVTFILFTALAAPVAALVYSIAFYSLVAWREKGSGKSDTPPPDGVPLRGNSTIAAVWIGTSVLLVLFLLVWGMAELSSETAPQTDAIQVNVTGQQWLWTFSYPGTGVTTNTLVLPEGRQVDFHVTSEDVTHGFWPIQLGVQIDANPNVVTEISATPNKLGTFNVRCSQICGLYHAYMQTTGTVVTNSQFADWLTSHGASYDAVQSYALSGK